MMEVGVGVGVGVGAFRDAGVLVGEVLGVVIVVGGAAGLAQAKRISDGGIRRVAIVRVVLTFELPNLDRL